MTIEEAIGVLDDMKPKTDIPKSAVTQLKRNEALNIAVSAVEKQIPKKPNVINNMGTTYCNCPTCSSLVADSIIGKRYLHNCGVCGQRIDWTGV